MDLQEKPPEQKLTTTEQVACCHSSYFYNAHRNHYIFISKIISLPLSLRQTAEPKLASPK